RVLQEPARPLGRVAAERERPAGAPTGPPAHAGNSCWGRLNRWTQTRRSLRLDRRTCRQKDSASTCHPPGRGQAPRALRLEGRERTARRTRCNSSDVVAPLVVAAPVQPATWLANQQAIRGG